VPLPAHHQLLLYSQACSRAPAQTHTLTDTHSYTLQAMPVSESAVVPVLQAAVPTPSGRAPSHHADDTPSKKHKKSSAKKGADTGATMAAGPVMEAGRLDLAVLMLEVLQWKAVQGACVYVSVCVIVVERGNRVFGDNCSC